MRRGMPVYHVKLFNKNRISEQFRLCSIRKAAPDREANPVVMQRGKLRDLARESSGAGLWRSCDKDCAPVRLHLCIYKCTCIKTSGSRLSVTCPSPAVHMPDTGSLSWSCGHCPGSQLRLPAARCGGKNPAVQRPGSSAGLGVCLCGRETADALPALLVFKICKVTFLKESYPTSKEFWKN